MGGGGSSNPNRTARCAQSGDRPQIITRQLRENEGKFKELRDALSRTLQRTEKQKREMDKEKAQLQANVKLLVSTQGPAGFRRPARSGTSV